ncbi:AAEL012221-PA [Aedes aegypti]|uniref:AAEL012221-PA n=1 Tax=Aedes aegypti TaxID=7159 RepID=Q16MR6_AEDAE|nr:AAEL012221-PA [Aedes aegypti]
MLCAPFPNNQDGTRYVSPGDSKTHFIPDNRKLSNGNWRLHRRRVLSNLAGSKLFQRELGCTMSSLYAGNETQRLIGIYKLSISNYPLELTTITCVYGPHFEYTCLCVGENPNHGYTNFDNFMWSMLTTFQLITLDYWENVYNMVLATCGPMSVSFFTVVVFFGSFYLINLMLAVVALSYEEEAEITQEERRKDLIDHRDDSTFSFDPASLNVKQLSKQQRKKLDARKGVLLASYSRKKTRRRKKGKEGGDNGNNVTKSRSVTPSPSPSPRHSIVRPQALALQRTKGMLTSAPPAMPPTQHQQQNPNTLHPLGLHYRGQLLPSSRQASSNASEGGVNRESSLDDSGVVDDHEEQDVVTGTELVHSSLVEVSDNSRGVTFCTHS